MISSDAGDFFDDIEAVDDFSEDGVSVVEVRRGDFSDEELRAVRIGASIRHGEDAGGVMTEFRAEFVAESVARAASANTARAAALDHEIGNDAVKDESIVERSLRSFPGQFIDELELPSREADKILDGIWDEVFVEFCGHIAQRSFEACIEFSGPRYGDVSEVFGIDERFSHERTSKRKRKRKPDHQVSSM